MAKDVQISARIASTTKALLDRQVRATGVKKGHLVQEALLHYLHALQEIPTDVIIHSRIVVTRKSWDRILHEIRNAKPTKALRDLMHDGD